MTTNFKVDNVPKALSEVWEWKDAIQDEVEDLSFHDAVNMISDMAHAVAVKTGFVPIDSPASHLYVAEESAGYSVEENEENTER